MKRIFLLLLSASVAASCSGSKNSVGKPGVKGELIPQTKSRTFVAERPYGMVAIPGGSFVAGLADQDFTGSPEKAPLKTVTVASFFMDEAETTNAEYRVFVNYVRDSIARTLLAEAAGEGDGSGGRGRSISDYAYKAANDKTLTPYEEFLESNGALDEAEKRLDWKQPLYWKPSSYPDVEYAEVIESMYLPAGSKASGERILDVSKLKYTYKWDDYQAALSEHDLGKSSLRSESIAVYPDTTVWVKDFNFSYNEPMFQQYFWHNAYKDYPVVGVTWDQARAYCFFRSKLKSDYNQSLRKKKQRPLLFRLPTEMEWEYAARGGLENATYPWGGPYLMDDRGCYLANFKPKRGNYIEDEVKGTYMYTAPVKKFKKNGFGLYDMAGNVSEWTDTPFNNSTYNFSSTLNPSTKNTSGHYKSVRGGSWKDIGMMLMVGYRDYEHKDSARSYIGFRTVQDIPEAAAKIKRRTN